MTIKEHLHIDPQDKTTETDWQMFKRISLRFILLFTLIVFSDTLIDWTFSVLSFIGELLHLGVEFVEYSLEVFLDFSFNTGDHISEIIIVNSVVLLILYLLYRSVKYIPTLFHKINHYFLNLYHQWMNYEVTCWHTLTLTRKIEVVTVYSFYIILLTFLITL